MTSLSVNVNAIAYLRNRRDLPWPDVVNFARIALLAGADGITVHPRPDERHIRRTDVIELSQMIKTEFADREFNIEGYPTDEFLDLVQKVRPAQATLVPDSPEQATSDHGWDIVGSEEVLRPAIARLKAAGIRVSLFIDPDPQVPGLAKKVDAHRVELYTATYAEAVLNGRPDTVLAGFIETAKAAQEAGIGVNAGHDLSLDNLKGFSSAIPFLEEVSIGHALTADALLYGCADAVRRYRAAL